MRNNSGFIGVIAAIFIGLFAFVFGASAGRKAQRYEQMNENKMVVVP